MFFHSILLLISVCLYQSVSAMEFDPREGLIGWIGDFTVHLPTYKKYISYVSSHYVEALYMDYAKVVKMEALKLKPVKEENIRDVFFKTSRSFSYHYNNEEFKITGCPMPYSLEEFLNFSAMPSSAERRSRQDLFVQGFVQSFKGFQSGKNMCIGKHDPTIADKEVLDKSHFIHLGLAHAMFPMTIYEEIDISGQDGHSLPHGNIDLLCVMEKDNIASAVSMCIYADEVEEEKRSVPTATTIKTNQSYGRPGSDRQAVVELLAISQVVLEKNPQIKVCIMIKATRHVFRPYFYLPPNDMLIRTNCDIALDGGNFNQQLVGNFIVSLILHHHINYGPFIKLNDSEAGLKLTVVVTKSTMLMLNLKNVPSEFSYLWNCQIHQARSIVRSSMFLLTIELGLSYKLYYSIL